MSLLTYIYVLSLILMYFTRCKEKSITSENERRIDMLLFCNVVFKVESS
jgi:hypothetical protein